MISVQAIVASFELRNPRESRPIEITQLLFQSASKVANRLAKKDPSAGGCRLLRDPAVQEEALQALALGDLWGIAKRMAARLEAESIRTPLELRAADPRLLRQRFGVVMQRIGQELRGVSCLPLELAVPDRKSLVASRSFGRPITVRADVEEAVASFASRAAAKMRRQGLATAHLSTFIETNPFREQDKQYRASRGLTLPVATADTATLITAAHGDISPSYGLRPQEQAGGATSTGTGCDRA